jgi:L,D-transpeptidase ErfK/SrfK
MKMLPVRALSVSVLCAALAGCSLFGAWHRAAPPAAQAAPPAPPPAPPPVANERFTLSPDQDVVGVVQVVSAGKDDTLTDIARRFNVGYEEILRANPKVDPWLPGEGREIIVPSQFILPDAPRTGIVINIPAMRIFYFPPVKRGEHQVVLTHPIGIGKVGWRTPEGVTKIVRSQKDPTWRVPVSVRKEHHENGEELEPVIGPGPDNPLGKYAFYLQWPSYLIHGTNKPAGVGLRSSHGCIRLYPDGELYMQAYDVMEDDTRDWKHAEKKLLTRSLATRLQQEVQAHHEQVDWSLVTSLARNPRGVPVPVTAPDSSLEQVLAAAPRVQNVLPEGSTWDGTSDLPMDEASFQQIVSEIEPGSDGSTPAPAAAPAAPAASGDKRATQKNGS